MSLDVTECEIISMHVHCISKMIICEKTVRKLVESVSLKVSSFPATELYENATPVLTDEQSTRTRGHFQGTQTNTWQYIRFPVSG